MSGRLALGIDAGGTRTRWALADSDGRALAEGEAPGMTALVLARPEGEAALRERCAKLAEEVCAHGTPAAILGGWTGLGEAAPALQRLLAGVFGLPPGQVHACSDIELAYRTQFDAGQGYLVYAGTGSIGAWIDEHGLLHRAGGRGVLLDDGGGGYWIAREALRHIWRNEDEQPGRWRESAMACAVFDWLGGEDWSVTRSFMYGRERGEIGQLARAVAASAGRDPAAHAILVQAGLELGRLANALCARFGPRPVLLAGRAATLHPIIGASLRTTLPAGVTLAQSEGLMHHGAASLAAQAMAGRTAWPALAPTA